MKHKGVLSVRTKDIPQNIKNEVINRYSVLGYGQIKTGQPWGYSVNLVKDILHEANIPIRNFSQAASQSNKNRAIQINHNYFEIETPNMAYLLGFIASDGTVRKDINEVKITLSAEDADFLQTIANELEYKGRIKTYTTQEGFSNSTLAFTSAQIKQSLAKYNIIPNKTYSFTFPTNLQRKYWRDFFRGYFDGDGTICQAGDALRLSICSYMVNILEIFIIFFAEEYNIPKVNIREKDNNHNYYFQYSTNAVREFYKVLYYDNCLCLPRKYEKFTELVNKFSTRL